MILGKMAFSKYKKKWELYREARQLWSLCLLLVQIHRSPGWFIYVKIERNRQDVLPPQVGSANVLIFLMEQKHLCQLFKSLCPISTLLSAPILSPSLVYSASVVTVIQLIPTLHIPQRKEKMQDLISCLCVYLYVYIYIHRYVHTCAHRNEHIYTVSMYLYYVYIQQFTVTDHLRTELKRVFILQQSEP